MLTVSGNAQRWSKMGLLLGFLQQEVAAAKIIKRMMLSSGNDLAVTVEVPDHNFSPIADPKPQREMT